MIKVNFFSALQKDKIKALLEANEDPTYKYIGDIKPNEMQFEVTYADGIDEGKDPAGYAKKLVQKQPWGAALYMRVLIDGQAFTGGVVK